jgi:hypothetical protein
MQILCKQKWKCCKDIFASFILFFVFIFVDRKIRAKTRLVLLSRVAKERGVRFFVLINFISKQKKKKKKKKKKIKKLIFFLFPRLNS